MTSLVHWLYPGDGATCLVVNLVVQIAAAVLIAAVVSGAALRRWPAAQHAVWLACLGFVLVCPLTAAVSKRSGMLLLPLLPSGEWHGVRVVSRAPTPESVEPTSRATDRGEPFPAAGRRGVPPRYSSGETPLLRDVHDSAIEMRGATALAAPVATAEPKSAPAENTAAAAKQSARPFDIRELVAAAVVVWAAGVLFLTARLLHGVRAVSRLRRASAPFDPSGLGDVLADVRRSLGMERLPPIGLSERIATPVVAGLFRPAVLLPASLAAATTPGRLRDILLHECAHVARRDSWVVVLQRLAAVVYWPHPLVHFLNRQLARCREEVCDNWVLRAVRPVDYADTLLEVAIHCRERFGADMPIGMFDVHGKVEDRVRRLLDRRRNAGVRLPARARWGVLAAAAIFLTVTAAFPLVAPARAEKQPGVEQASSKPDRPGAVNVTEDQTGHLLAGSGANPDAGWGGEVTIDGQKFGVGVNRDAGLVGNATMDEEDSQRGKSAGAPEKRATEKESRELEVARQRAVAFLFKRQDEGGMSEYGGQEGGIPALATLALLKSGVKPDNPRLGKLLARVRELKTGQTYVTSLQTLVLCAAEPKKDLDTIRRNVKWLEETQIQSKGRPGAWSYGTITLVEAKNVVSGDNSNTQFAMLALHEAELAGAAVDEKTWRLALDHWLHAQNENGSWSYIPNIPGSGSMTCAGVACVSAASRRVKDKAKVEASQTAVKRAEEWLTKRFTVQHDPFWGGENGLWHFYYLSDLERAARLADWSKIGDYDWRQEGIRALLKEQNIDGSWKGRAFAETDPVIATSLVLLFLRSEPAAAGQTRRPRVAALGSKTKTLTGVVAAPDGAPLADVLIEYYLSYQPKGSNETHTDKAGRFRVTVPAAGEAVLLILPKQYAAMGLTAKSQQTDLGVLTMKKGTSLSGTVLDVDGKLVAGWWFEIQVDRGGTTRPVGLPLYLFARSDAKGKVTFDPLPPDDYRISAIGPIESPLEIDGDNRATPKRGVYYDKKVRIDGGDAKPFELNAQPTVKLVAQFYGSDGKKISDDGSFICYGNRPGGVNESWAASGVGEDGRYEMLAPRGMAHTRLSVRLDGDNTYRLRKTADAPLESGRELDLGTLGGDLTDIRIIRYAPTALLVKVSDTAGKPVASFQIGKPIPSVQVSARYDDPMLNQNSPRFVDFEKQKDGRFRTGSLLPDEKFTVTVTADGYRPQSRSLSLAEGTTSELDLVLERR